MAQIPGTVGKRRAFGGGADVFYVKLQQINRKGIQIVAEGFNIEDATVNILFPGEEGPVKQQPQPLEVESVTIATVGENFSMDGIEIGDLPAGEYYITIVQL